MQTKATSIITRVWKAIATCATLEAGVPYQLNCRRVITCAIATGNWITKRWENCRFQRTISITKTTQHQSIKSIFETSLSFQHHVSDNIYSNYYLHRGQHKDCQTVTWQIPWEQRCQNPSLQCPTGMLCGLSPTILPWSNPPRSLLPPSWFRRSCADAGTKYCPSRTPPLGMVIKMGQWCVSISTSIW